MEMAKTLPSENPQVTRLARSHTTDFSKHVMFDTSRLISSQSQVLSSVVDNVPVLDRLTVDYIVPEAEKHLGEQDVNADHFYFKSSTLNKSIPNCKSLMDLTQFKNGPYHHCRLRGMTASFEKIPITPLGPTKSMPIIDTSNFWEREGHHLALKEEYEKKSKEKLDVYVPEITPTMIKRAENALKRREVSAEKEKEETIMEERSHLYKKKGSCRLAEIVVQETKDYNAWQETQQIQKQRDEDKLLRENAFKLSEKNKRICARAEKKRKQREIMEIEEDSEAHTPNSPLEEQTKSKSPKPKSVRQRLPSYMRELYDFTGKYNVPGREAR